MKKLNPSTAKRVIFSLLVASALGGCAVYSPAPYGYVEPSVRVDYGYYGGDYRGYRDYGYRDDGYRYRGNRGGNYSTGGSVGVSSPGVSVGVGGFR